LDNLKMFDYVVTPYDDHWEVRPLIDVYFFFSGWLRFATVLTKHFLECVLKQFKYVQDILRDPVASVTPDMNVFQIECSWKN
jgi:hypothetical protein